MESVQKGTVRRDWNNVDNRNGRDVLEKRQRRETEGAVFETRGTGKEDGLDVLRDVLLRLRSLSAYVYTCIIIRIHTRTRSRSPPNVQHFTSNTRNAHAHILPRAGHGRRLRTYVPSPDRSTIPVYACVHAYTYTWNSTYACVHVYTYTCNISP